MNSDRNFFKRYKESKDGPWCANCGRSLFTHKGLYCCPMTEDEYDQLKASGMLFELYPGFTGQYDEDILENS